MSNLLDPVFDGVLGDLEGLEEHQLRGLIERADQIFALSQHPGWAYLQDYLVALTTKQQRRILSGACRNIEDYRTATGYVRGLQASLDAHRKLQDEIARLQASQED